MKTILIVDDDALARIGIKSINDFEEHGYSIIGEAENGNKALELAEKYQPDVILSDILMPGYNGVKLMELCKEKGIKSSFIMLSSHDDFTYVRDSMKMGALDYILKIDMKKNQIVNLLDQYCTEIGNKVAVEETSDIISSVINKGNPICIEDIKKLTVSLNYNKRLPYRVVSIKLLQFSHSLISDTDLQRILKPALNLCLDISKEFKGSYVQHIAGKSFFCFIPVSLEMMDNNIAEKEFKIWANKICIMFNKVLDITVIIGFSSLEFSLSSFLKALVEANKSAVAAIKSGNSYQFSEYLKTEKETSNCNIIGEIADIRKALFSFNSDKVKLCFSRIIDKLFLENLSSSVYRSASYMILFVCVNYFKSIGYCYTKEANDETFIAEESEVSQFINWIGNMKEEVLKSLIGNKGTQKQIVVAKKFINEHYSEAVTLQKISHEVGLSSTYFSRLFYHATGQKFIDYLTEVRINNALILLETSHYRIQNIAEMVGYDNSTYFSYLFKKTQGISPQEYRSKVNS